MGRPVCARLTAARFEVTATDIDPAGHDAAAAVGARWVPDARDLADCCEVVISLLPGASEVVAVAEALAGAQPAGSLWLEMSTVPPATAAAVAAAVRGRDLTVLDAPVGGGPGQAADGALLSFVGGDAAALAVARPVLGALADRIVHVGEAGSGYTVKLLANLLWFGQAVASAEALTLARQAGLDLATVLDALGESAASSRFLTHDAWALLDGDDMSAFSLARCCEQLSAVLELGEELGVPLALAAVVDDVHRLALERYGEVDGELLGARFVAERAGVPLHQRR
jgi:3-hydroxyisobutyrate dehydrogenase